MLTRLALALMRNVNMDNYNNNAAGEMIGRIGCGALIIAIVAMIIVWVL